jgi:MFS family permease
MKDESLQFIFFFIFHPSTGQVVRMKTLQLLFSTTWRGGMWGLLAGTMVGATFGALFGNVLVFGVGLTQQQEQISLNDIPAAIGAVAILAIIGSVMGALFGVPTGFVVGIANGLLLGIISRVFFFPLKNARAYRWVIALISMAFTTLASWVGFMLIMFLYANQDKADWVGIVIFLVVPALIAGVVAGFISQIGARWYEKKNTK